MYNIYLALTEIDIAQISNILSACAFYLSGSKSPNVYLQDGEEWQSQGKLGDKSNKSNEKSVKKTLEHITFSRFLILEEGKWNDKNSNWCAREQATHKSKKKTIWNKENSQSFKAYVIDFGPKSSQNKT